jgi:hypothetical protein
VATSQAQNRSRNAKCGRLGGIRACVSDMTYRS